MNHAHGAAPDRRRHAVAARGADPQVRVTLSDDLLNHLRRVAQQEHVPLRWLVAGLVCDTFEAGLERPLDRQLALAGR
jgi:hypothetical protein